MPVRGIDQGADSSAADGIGRRKLIKRAAAAGAVAWTAPLVVDSLASPAAAATVATGCYRVELSGNCNATGINLGSCGFPAGWASAGAFPQTVSCSGSATQHPTRTLSLPSDSGCVFHDGVSRAALFGIQGCHIDNGAGGTTMSFTKSVNGSSWTGFRVVIRCGGATSCP